MNHGKLALVKCKDKNISSFLDLNTSSRSLSPPLPERSLSPSGPIDIPFNKIVLPEECIRDIQEDYRSFQLDERHLQQSSSTTSPLSRLTVHQPNFDFTSAGVVKLSKQSDTMGQDHLLDLLTTTYLKTKRDSNHKKRVTIINAEGLTESYEFSKNNSYWQFIASVKRSFDGIPVTYCNRFTITQSELTASASSGNGGNKGGKYDLKVAFVIRNFKLHYQLPKKDSTPTVIDLMTLKALALSDDFARPLGMLLKMSSFSCNWEKSGRGLAREKGFDKQLLPRIFGSLQYQSCINEHNINSISEEVLLSGLCSNSESSSFYCCSPTPLALGLLVSENDRGGIVSLKVNSEPPVDDEDGDHVCHEQSDERILVGSAEAPILYFVSSNNSRRNSPQPDQGPEHDSTQDFTGHPQTLEVKLTAPGANSLARLMIYSIEEVPMSQPPDEHSSMLDRWSSQKKSRNPDVYCVVSVLLRDGQKMNIKST